MLGKSISRRMAGNTAEIVLPNHEAIVKAARTILHTTQDVVNAAITENKFSNIHHLDPHNRGFKPGALNIAYQHIISNQYIDEVENNYFIIIDSDSLLPNNALSVISKEISRDEYNHNILQMISTPTANYFSGGVFSKFISIELRISLRFP